MIRDQLIIAVFLMLALPASAADSTAPLQAPVAANERPGGHAADGPIHDLSQAAPVAPVTPATAATPVLPTVPAASAAITPAAPAANVSPQAPPVSRVSSPPDLTPMLFGLLVVLALMAGAVWLMKRMGMVKTGAASVGKIIGGVSLGNRERLVIVEVADQWIVVGVAPGRVSALAQLPRQERSEAKLETAPAAPNFSEWLKQTIDKRNGNNAR